MARGGMGGGMGGGGWRRDLTVEEKAKELKITRSILERVFAYGRPYWSSISIVIVCIAFVSLIELVPPLLYRELIDEVLPNGDYAKLNLLALGMLGIPLISG